MQSAFALPFFLPFLSFCCLAIVLFFSLIPLLCVPSPYWLHLLFEAKEKSLLFCCFAAKQLPLLWKHSTAQQCCCAVKAQHSTAQHSTAQQPLAVWFGLLCCESTEQQPCFAVGGKEAQQCCAVLCCAVLCCSSKGKNWCEELLWFPPLAVL